MHKEIIIYSGTCILYSASSLIYIIILHNFNHAVLEMGLAQKPFELIGHNNYQAMYLLFFAGVFVLLGGLLIKIHISRVLYSELELSKAIASIIEIFVVATIMVAVIILIQNPILRAVLAVFGTGFALSGTASK